MPKLGVKPLRLQCLATIGIAALMATISTSIGADEGKGQSPLPEVSKNPPAPAPEPIEVS